MPGEIPGGLVSLRGFGNSERENNKRNWFLDENLVHRERARKGGHGIDDG
jgi:hypothetical protein